MSSLAASSRKSTSGLSGPFASLEGLSAAWLSVAFVVLLLLIFSRRPQDLVHAQFYAEDGKRWFAQAYNLGWFRSLPIPDAAYIHVLPRLAAGLALWAPLAWAPTVMNVCGAMVQVLPAVLLLSRRCCAWGPLWLRVLLAAVYVATPNAYETHVNMTNGQWHLALAEALVAFSLPPRTRLGKAGDVCLFVIGDISGPFCIVLLPVLLLFWWLRRQRWTLVLVAIVSLGVVLQTFTILSVAHHESPVGSDVAAVSTRLEAAQTPLGATPARLVRILGRDVFVNSLIGYRYSATAGLAVPLAGLLLGVAVLFFGLRRAPLAFRLFALQVLGLLMAALKSPVVFIAGLPRWEILARYGGIRYYTLPTLVFLWAAVYCASVASPRLLRVFGSVVLLASLFGMVRKWHYPSQPDMHFATEVRRFDQAGDGTPVTINIVPAGWSMTLIKH